MLDGSASTDASGDPLTYSWSFVSKPVGSSVTLSQATTAKPTFTPDVDGSYRLVLYVNDGKIDSTPSYVNITATSDPAKFFDTSKSFSGNRILDFVQTGSRFSSNIVNTSNETFQLIKYELSDGVLLVERITSPTSLNNNQLAPGESVGITVTLNARQDLGFVASYYFTDPVSGNVFTVQIPYY